MAIWRSENIVITEKGLEVLSNILAGKGGMTITRVVSGSGEVPFNSLAQQVQVSDIKQELNIVEYAITSSGTSLSLTLDNAELEEEYYLTQLGVYITHPSFSGEILYLLAQCSEADLVPLPNPTNIIGSYTLFVGHSNTTDVTVKALENSVVTTGILQQHRKNPYVHAKAFDTFMDMNYKVVFVKERGANMPTYNESVSLSDEVDMTYYVGDEVN